MLNKAARNPAYSDNDPPVVLALRYATEPQPHSARVPFLLLAVMQLSFLVLLTASPTAPRSVDKRKKTAVTKLYLPPQRVTPPVKRETLPPQSLSRRIAPPPMYDADMTPSAARKFDLSSTEISIAEDVTNQLPEVVRQQNGVLALIDRDDPSIARYIFAPPDWAFKDGIVDVSDMIRISMAPASKWKLLRSLAERYSIDLDRYQVCALFQTAYARCLDREIRNRADAQPGRGRVKSASLVFTSARTCGIDVLNVQFVDP